jgi:hypothetical protein
MDRKPSIGRIVIFTTETGTKCPAIITRVWSDTCVNLRLFLDHDQHRSDELQGETPTSVTLDPNGGKRTWSWPGHEAFLPN